MLKNFNYSIFIIAANVFGLLAIFSFISSLSFFEGTSGTGSFLEFTSWSLYIFWFPVNSILSLFNISFPPLFIIGFILDCAFYGLLTERIFSLITKNKKP